ncbi:hypothetical protein X548_16545 [Stenotrophomonas maltophilia 5BA-I-2]|nr:hypothetical protein X548_16545 [Stenotrophomonas maltophilia 5BA-I-2]
MPTRDDLIREVEAYKHEVKELKSRLDAVKASRLSSNLTVVAKEALRWTGITVSIVLSVKFLAGQTTKVDAAVSFGAELAEAVKELAPAWWLQITSVIFMGFAWRSRSRYRNINKSLVSQLSEKTKQIETMLDPTRTSSKLGEDGETHRRDEL